MKTWFFLLLAVGDQPSYHIDHKIGRASVPNMRNLGNVFALGDNRLNDGSFVHQEFIQVLLSPARDRGA